MPYEEIDEEEYNKRASTLRNLDLDTDKDHLVLRVKDEPSKTEDPLPENYCDGDTCKL